MAKFGDYYWDESSDEILFQPHSATSPMRVYHKNEYENTDGLFNNEDLAWEMFESESKEEIDEEIKSDSNTYWVRVLLCLPKIELVGALSKGQQGSKNRFDVGFRELFPASEITIADNSIQYTSISSSIYKGLRCGYFHSGMIESDNKNCFDINITRGFRSGSNSIRVSGNRIDIDADLFTQIFSKNFLTFLSAARADSSKKARMLKIWARRWG